MTSKAKQYADAVKAVHVAAVVSEPFPMTGGHVRLAANGEGGLEFSTTGFKRSMTAQDAIEMARWILANFEG